MAAVVKYPYPSTLNVGNFVTIKLTQSNFLLWKTQVLGLIESQEMMGFIDGEYPIPDRQITIPDTEVVDGKNVTINPAYNLWRRSDRLLRGWITGTLSEEVLGMVVGLETASEVWNTLSNSFAQESQEREFFLLQQLQLHRKGYGTTNHNVAFLGQRSQGQRDNRTFYRRGRSNQVSFNSRGRGFPHTGHVPSRVQRDKFFQPAQNQSGSIDQPNQANQSGSIDQLNQANQFHQPAKEKGEVCQICMKPNHTALRCWQRFNQTYQSEDIPQALAAMSLSNSQDNAWFPDTGASSHMTADAGTDARTQAPSPPFIGSPPSIDLPQVSQSQSVPAVPHDIGPSNHVNDPDHMDSVVHGDYGDSNSSIGSENETRMKYVNMEDGSDHAMEPPELANPEPVPTGANSTNQAFSQSDQNRLDGVTELLSSSSIRSDPNRVLVGHPMVTRLKDGIVKPNPKYSFTAMESYSEKSDDDHEAQNPTSTSSAPSSPDSSPTRMVLPSKTSAPKVDDTMLALTVAGTNRTLNKPIDPVQHVVNFNPTYDQLWTPIYGPAHPYAKDGIAQGMRNHKLGFVENAAIEPFVFDEQYNTFHKYGYAADPSASAGNNYVGDLEALQKNDGGDVDMSEIENPASEEWLKKNRKSPWADKSTFHGKEERDYQGRSWIAPPKDAKAANDHCYIPKRWVHTWSGHTKGVSAIRFFPKHGHLLLSAGMDTKIKIWDVYNSGKCMRTYMGHSKAVRDISFSNDGSKFLSTGYDKNIKFWDTETGKVISTFSTGKIPYVVKLNPDDDKQNILLAGMSDKKIVQWDMNTGQITQEYDQHLGAVNTITFVDNNRRFVTSSDDKSLRVWEFGIPVVIKYISEPHMHSMPAISLHPNSNWLAAQSLDNQILIYSTRERFQLNKKKRFAGHIVAGYACQVNFSPDGRFVMSGDGEGKCWFWDWKSCKVFRTLKCHEGVCIGCEWHPLEQSKVATCGWDGMIKYW
ncbi:hypothetical protein HHK36_024921 [Tetracentron sinense]|uniref:Pre-mRNA-processing factor 17 n=1 Tax=Tetracentron sinense TaxID=13715 RepID=A0A834YLR5_TETSI|nr:hypothetical protein HHK36_024921 [Tetracentron sinense]